MLNCIRCGACQNVCPVYRQVGGTAYGWVYGGPIGAVLTPLLHGDQELAQASSLCAACDDVCPVRIPLHDLLLAPSPRPRGRARPAGRSGWLPAVERGLEPAVALPALDASGREVAPRAASAVLRRWTRTRDLEVHR